MVESGGGTATGLPIPDEVVEALGRGKRPPVRITIGGHSYRTTVSRMGGRYLVPLAAEHRQAAGVTAGQRVVIEIEYDDAPREVDVPKDLAAALDREPQARQSFERLSYTHRKEWARWVAEAKKPETRERRIAKTVEALAAGRGAEGV